MGSIKTGQIVTCRLTPSWSSGIVKGQKYTVAGVTKTGKVTLEKDSKGLRTSWEWIFFDLDVNTYCHDCMCSKCKVRR